MKRVIQTALALVLATTALALVPHFASAQIRSNANEVTCRVWTEANEVILPIDSASPNKSEALRTYTLQFRLFEGDKGQILIKPYDQEQASAVYSNLSQIANEYQQVMSPLSLAISKMRFLTMAQKISREILAVQVRVESQTEPLQASDKIWLVLGDDVNEVFSQNPLEIVETTLGEGKVASRLVPYVDRNGDEHMTKISFACQPIR